MGRRAVKLSGTAPAVSKAMETRITGLVSQYIEELRRSDQSVLSCLQEHNSREMVALIKDRNQGRDLGRMKDSMLRPCVDRTYDLIRNEERAQALNEEDGDEEDEDREDLMEAKDTNQMNKSVVGLWNVAPVTTDSAQTTDTNDGATSPVKKRTREEDTGETPVTKGDNDEKEKQRKPKKQKGKKGIYKKNCIILLCLFYLHIY